MKGKPHLLACLVLGAALPLTAADFNVRAYGATGDGRTLDTGAINAAIAAAATAGGGTVEFPAGTYASFSIHLRSNVTLHLEAGSTILAAEPPADLSIGYDPPESNPGADLYEDFGHSHWHNSLIWGEGLDNIAITGPGRIFGRGLSRSRNRRDLLPAERRLPPNQRPDVRLPAAARAAIAALKPGPFGYPRKDTLPAGVGDKSIALKNCRNVILRDFTVFHGGHFGILATGVDNLTIDNLKIDTNRDGMDIDCCRNVRISDCTVNSPNDDGICLKASYGLGVLRPTQNVTITGCQVSGFEEGTLLDGTYQPKESGLPAGRIKLGTEATGGFKNIVITNCVFDHSKGLALEQVDGAELADVAVSNLVMRHIAGAPIFIRLGARLRAPGHPMVSTVRNISISNLVVTDVAAGQGILIAGSPGHPIQHLSLSHISIQFQGGGTKEQATREVPEMEKDYPDPRHYGVLPSWGMFARHVRDLSIDHVTLWTAQPDLRPAVILDDISGAELDHVDARPAAGAPTLVLKNVTGLSVQSCPGVPAVRREQPVKEEKW